MRQDLVAVLFVYYTPFSQQKFHFKRNYAGTLDFFVACKQRHQPHLRDSMTFYIRWSENVQSKGVSLTGI